MIRYPRLSGWAVWLSHGDLNVLTIIHFIVLFHCLSRKTPVWNMVIAGGTSLAEMHVRAYNGTFKLLISRSYQYEHYD